MSTDREAKKVRVKALRDCVATGGRDLLKGETYEISAADARFLALDGRRGGAGGDLVCGPSPSVLILSGNEV